MKHRIRELVESSIRTLVDQGEVPPEVAQQSFPIEYPRREGHGDFATSAALAMAKQSGKRPRDLALLIQENLPDSPILEKTEIAGPGFINFFLTERAYAGVVNEIRKQSGSFGHLKPKQSQRVLVEFVSANPTGPLHVGHGRGAAVGDTLVRILRAAGHQVDTEYYVNDIGRQMNILALSVWIRYLQLQGLETGFPQGAYQGDYVSECAAALQETCELKQVQNTAELFDDLPDSNDEVLDCLIDRAMQLLGRSNFENIRKFALNSMVDVIRTDLDVFGVQHQQWFFESNVVDSGEIKQAISNLRDSGQLYESEGAVWFRSTAHGDEKDRVVVRSNSELTYFATDIAYHLNKYKRGYNKMINIWGADHHGYITRMMAAMEASGEDSGKLEILVVQLAALRRGEKKIALSTRAGDFVSLKDLVEEIGSDAARFFYILRKPQQHLDFDLDLAKSKTNENPVYYVQYAHARVCSVFRQMHERGLQHPSNANHELLSQESEIRLLKKLSQYPEIIESSAESREPHQIAYYLREVATEFHSFYNKERILDSEPALRDARLDLVDAVRQVLANGLELLGVSAPEVM